MIKDTSSSAWERAAQNERTNENYATHEPYSIPKHHHRHQPAASYAQWTHWVDGWRFVLVSIFFCSTVSLPGRGELTLAVGIFLDFFSLRITKSKHVRVDEISCPLLPTLCSRSFHVFGRCSPMEFWGSLFLLGGKTTFGQLKLIFLSCSYWAFGCHIVINYWEAWFVDPMGFSY